MIDNVDNVVDYSGTLTISSEDYGVYGLAPEYEPYIGVNCVRIGEHDFPMPSKGSTAAAGFDLRTIQSCCIYPGDQVVISTGWAFEIPRGFVGLIRDRSGMAMSRMTTRAGVIDSDYRGEIKVLLVNEGSDRRNLNAGDRIAQIIFIPIYGIQMNEIAKMSDTQRGENGFGSTGVK